MKRLSHYTWSNRLFISELDLEKLNIFHNDTTQRANNTIYLLIQPNTLIFVEIILYEIFI